MPSTLACIGLDVAGLDELNQHLTAMPTRVAGRLRGVESVRHDDPSGSRVVVVQDPDGQTIDLVPSYDGVPGARLGGLVPHGAVVLADVLDDDDQLVTRLAVDLEQRRHLGAGLAGPVRASVAALGVEMTVHADAAAFAASEASLLGEPGPEEQRFAAESFVSYGAFADPAAAEPTAHLAGTVLLSEGRTHEVTGQRFQVAKVRTLGFEVTVCLAASAHPEVPQPGQVVAGSCWLVADVPTLWTVEPPRRRRRGRR
ncbi:hypothetical protein [Nocardioides litoris]|uniref:hypothetical protein n=1 Tax=Nocardioides litoris TaxID=1926648 RepID=UPI0011227B40|nr:hypothetical protein [Nocardioides litoris]